MDESTPKPGPGNRRRLLSGALGASAIAGGIALGTIGSPSAHADPRPGQSPFAERSSLPVNVKAHGARGDGSHDDTRAIQEAIDAASAVGGGEVFFPAGQYAVSSTLEVQSARVVLAGEGAGSQILRSSKNAGGFLVSFIGPPGRGGNYARDVGLRDLYFGVQGDPPAGGAILLQQVLHFFVVRCHVVDQNGPGIKIVDAYIGKVLQSQIQRCQGDGVSCQGENNVLRIADSRIQANRGVGIRLPDSKPSPNFPSGSASGICITGTDLEGNGDEAIRFTDGKYRGITITGCYFESNDNVNTGGAGTAPDIHKVFSAGSAVFRGVVIMGCNFVNRAATPRVVIESGQQGILGPNSYSNFHGYAPEYQFGSTVSTWTVWSGTAFQTVGADVEVGDSAHGVVLRSPGGTRFRLAVADDGSVSTSRL